MPFNRFLILTCTAYTALTQPALADLNERVSAAPAIDLTSLAPRLDKAEKIEEPASSTEEYFSGKSGETLSQFGYDMFETEALTDKDSSAKRLVGKDYVLGSGDKLSLHFSGGPFTQHNGAIFSVTDNGLIIIDGLPPISVAGKTIDQAQAQLNKLTSAQHNTNAHISLDTARHLNILLAGNVEKPGLKTLSSVSSVLDALLAADGILKSGSLRQIRLIRNGKTHHIDLYSALHTHESDSAADMILRDGDRIIVPPLGPTFAISGHVKRPAIYELLPTLNGMLHSPHSIAQNLSLNRALDLAGGTVGAAAYRFLNITYDKAVLETSLTVNHANAPLFGNGSILKVEEIKSIRENQVTISGASLLNGEYSLSESPTLGSIIVSSRSLGEGVYPLMGLIKRWHPNTQAFEIIDFPLSLVLGKQYDAHLQSNDEIILLSQRDIRNLQNLDKDKQDSDKKPKAQNKDSRGSETENVRVDEKTGESEFYLTREIVEFLKERSLFIRGAVRHEGAYPVSDTTTLSSVIAIAGGLTHEAKKNAIEITHSGSSSLIKREHIDFSHESADNIALEAGDHIRINQRFHKIANKSVYISGEVHYPGHYDLLPDDTMLSLLQRAGGLTDQAYAEGAIFSRKSERKAEENRYKSQARMIRQAVASSLQSNESDNVKINAAQLNEARALASELDKAKGIGRITIEADPAILRTQPELNMLLEAGDKVFIPRRNLTVRVRGEILSAAALQFRSGKDPLDYIHEAGGFTYHADKERSFVIYPDGSAQPLEVSSWNHTPIKIPPGSTIIVPRDPKPFDFIDSFKDVTQILSNLAITSIFIDDLNDD